jgi:hypothetical protein
MTIVVAAPQRRTSQGMQVSLRGPDGQVRQFALEGGRAAIQYQPEFVLRPGESVTIQWLVGK